MLFNMQRQTFDGLWGRYTAVLRQAWAHRRENDTPPRLSHELEFLPAHLELTETPPHPAPLWLARVLLATLCIVLLIAVFGRLDIVAVAPGTLIPTANVKVVQPAVTGVVRRLLVRNGQRVAAGELLVELDPTQAAADTNRATSDRIDGELAAARGQALLVAQDKNQTPRVSLVPDVTPERQSDSQNLVETAYREYLQKVLSLRAELEKREAELATVREEIAKLTETSALARQQADDYKELASGHYVPSHDYLDKESKAIEQTRNLAAARSREKELQAGIAEQQLTIKATIAEFRREQWQVINKAKQDAEQGQDEEIKASARQGLTQIRSPVSGVVQQLNIHTVGGVVSSAQTLMEIVPDDTLEVEAHVSNKDIGFVSEGQKAMIKIATFPYTRFGLLTGQVEKVSTDATSDKKLGMVFLARIKIPTNSFPVGEKRVNLSPGMEVTAEIKTGRERVWQYFLSPLLATGNESLRER